MWKSLILNISPCKLVQGIEVFNRLSNSQISLISYNKNLDVFVAVDESFINPVFHLILVRSLGSIVHYDNNIGILVITKRYFCSGLAIWLCIFPARHCPTAGTWHWAYLPFYPESWNHTQLLWQFPKRTNCSSIAWLEKFFQSWLTPRNILWCTYRFTWCLVG